jgi:hypothetical protein
MASGSHVGGERAPCFTVGGLLPPWDATWEGLASPAWPLLHVHRVDDAFDLLDVQALVAGQPPSKEQHVALQYLTLMDGQTKVDLEGDFQAMPGMTETDELA